MVISLLMGGKKIQPLVPKRRGGWKNNSAEELSPRTGVLLKEKERKSGERELTE